MKGLILGLALLATGFQAKADAHTVGSGGDAFRLLFEQAQVAAASKMSQVLWCSFAPTVPQSTVEWIVANRAQIEDDIRKSTQIWAVDPISGPTCAFTEHRPGAPIYLSYPTCIQSVGTDLTRAIFVTLHETAHHLGIVAENDADQIATAIMNATPQTSCAAPANDPFNPMSCTGAPMTKTEAVRYFDPGSSTSRPFGRSAFYQRVRNCNVITQCGPWQSTAPALWAAIASFGVQRFEIPRPLQEGGLRLYTLNSGDILLQIPFNASDLSANCTSIGMPTISCSTFRTNIEGYTRDLYYPNPNGGGYDTRFTLSGVLTNRCLRLSSNYMTSKNANGNYLNYETVWFGQF